MKEFTLVTDREAIENIVRINVRLFEGSKKPTSEEGLYNAIALWFVIIDKLTSQVEMSEFKRQDGEERLVDKVNYTENAFIDWEILDQNIAIPSALKQRILAELQMH
jgi:hypothetical protein